MSIELIRIIEEILKLAYPNIQFPNEFRNETLPRFVEYLNDQVIINNLSYSCNRIKGDPTGTIKYFCKVCWSDIEKVRHAQSLMRWKL